MVSFAVFPSPGKHTRFKTVRTMWFVELGIILSMTTRPALPNVIAASDHGDRFMFHATTERVISLPYVLKTPPAPWDEREFQTSPHVVRFTMTDATSKYRQRGIAIISEDPWAELSVEEPVLLEEFERCGRRWGGGKKSGRCKKQAQGCAGKQLSPVSQTAAVHGCDIAVNAGYFKISDGSCKGLVVSKGTIVQHTMDSHEAPVTAHFGILTNGSLFIGYPPSSPASPSRLDSFRELVGGALWIIRDGRPNWDRSAPMEPVSVQGTGSWDRFINMPSGRTAVGWDERGRIIVVAVDGKTDVDGTTVAGVARAMMYFGAVEAVNLDGGGSVTVVADGVVMNSPANPADQQQWKPAEASPNWINVNAERAVSTILCFKRTSKNGKDGA